ncbi:MAG: transcription elongation factor GreA [Buchnera aphidicola (Periphyllus lyropictus)]|uniref:transcription elongation factor GreA n=1 Tax=Buchnera aphidicola TaxID=9 RepID=UPI001ECE22BB|nr:transcription elongation factor GreA [Buchnera aphidicola]NIH16570.1 transcription elongation factor GreA [Buchnera aphidicola (Periphyllus lyropictus)]USS94460.1 transcription elongation factor GreA [Buchnera aphidicola (Periphyllus lyropictus)]
MENNIPMTINGQNKLREELNKLKNVIRPKIISDIAKARAHGDLKENAEYHSAKEEQSFCEGRIQEIIYKLSHANVIDVKKMSFHKKIFFGATVNILNIDSKDIYVYKIVGDDEANFKKQLISINSPMAQGLIGKKKNELTTIKTPSGHIKYKILKVKYI